MLGRERDSESVRERESERRGGGGESWALMGWN